MGEEKKRLLPLFATGEIVGDYEPLYRYWREAGDKAGEAVLTSSDFNELKRLVEEEGVERLNELLDRLVEWFKERVDAVAAQRALTDYYGSSLDPASAQEAVARILAGWLVEAGTVWNILRLRPSWEKR